MDEITLYVVDESGNSQPLQAPTDMGLSLMEFLKANDYPILATCGGMALCATCHIEVLENGEKLPQPGDAELDMLDTLPALTDHSRLSCQLRIADELHNLKFRIVG
jgi:2Fe-2S ferredoxin